MRKAIGSDLGKGMGAVGLERASCGGRGRLVAVVSGFFVGSGDLGCLKQRTRVGLACWAREG
ncbi:hypothetical protein TIFTF001_010073 [Ficus carica]|uniref:Uncharacterized protein n=1 Tax=Ficus carica TaxID=3494 RepID=A0AA87ZUV8_FICCA|nr:hypothetical protein TIFTF001_010073 [Ficus carica]